MALELRGVHKYERIPGTAGEARLTGLNPYVRITRGDHPPIYVQGGQVYGEGGGPIEPLPDWFPAEMARLSPKVRAEVGWRDDQPAPPPPPSTPAASWTCPEQGCGKTMPAKQKGLHVARHRKAAKGA